MSKIVDLQEHEDQGIQAPLIRQISLPFAGTSFERRLLKRLRFSIFRGILALFLGLLLGPLLLALGPLIILLIGSHKSRKNPRKKASIISIISVGILTLFILLMNIVSVYYLWADYWDVEFSVIYLPLFVSYTAILLDLILEYGTNRQITICDYLMAFCVKNVFIDLYHDLDASVHPKFEKLWHYLSDYTQ